MVEIGPGKGALTSHLLERADHVVAIEIDPILVQYLRAKFRGNDRLEVIAADILKVDVCQWGPAVIAGNLPYYIVSPIVTKVLGMGGRLARAVFLVQKEVADRLAASPGSRDYGYLSVATQVSAEVELLFAVPPAAFHPMPKVDSAVVRLTPRAQPQGVDPTKFLHFVSLAFQHKRKTLRNNLAGEYDRAVLDTLPEGKLRAEQMSIEALVGLYGRLQGVVS